MTRAIQAKYCLDKDMCQAAALLERQFLEWSCNVDVAGWSPCGSYWNVKSEAGCVSSRTFIPQPNRLESS